MRRNIGYIIAAVVFAVVCGVAWAVEAEGRFWAECRASGGEKVLTGTRTQMLLVGKLIVPHQAPQYECRPTHPRDDR